MRIRSALVVPVLGVAIALAACGADRDGSATTASGEDDLSIMEMACRPETPLDISSFDLTPVIVDGHTVLRGTLLDASGVATVYICTSGFHGTGGGGGEIVITCDEREAPTRKQEWNVEVVRVEDGRVLRANITRGARAKPVEADKPIVDLSLACTTLQAGIVPPSYATIAPYVHRACDGCHAEKFDSLEKIKAQQSIMLALITAGAMPRRDREWKDTFEGRQVLAFLARSKELR